MSSVHVPVYILLIILGLACAHISKNSNDNLDDLIGQCDKGSNCSECYQMLVIALLSKDQNLFNLSKAFFPTNSDDRPQFVTITYRFNDTNETKTWYWSEKGSFFVYPLQTFEYLSLFFGKASAFFSGSVTVTLDQDCADAEEDFMQHLTQRIKLYIAKKSILPEIDDSYIAAAHNDETWMDELQANKNQLVNIAYCMPILASVAFIIFAAIFVGTAFCSYKESIQKLKVKNSMLISNKWRSAIVAIALISVINIIYALGASCYAWAAIKDQPKLASESDLLSNVSLIAAIADAILLVLCIVTDILAFFLAIKYSLDCAYIILGCTSLYSLLCILQHCPYIILAYINDAELTGSIFIFYTISWSLIFLAISRFYTIYHELMLPCCNIFNDDSNVDTVASFDLEALIPNTATSETDLNSNLEASLTSTTGSTSESEVSVDQHRPRDQYEDLDRRGSWRISQRCKKLFCRSFFFILCSLVICILIIGSVTLLTCYLIILPITNGLSHLFGRLIDTYHTAIVIVGAFVAYKTFIENRNDSQTEEQTATGQNEGRPTAAGYGALNGHTVNGTSV